MSAETVLFSTALGLRAPWHVSDVRFDEEAKELHIYLDFARGSVFPCPGCDAPVKAYDTKEHVWRHLNFFEHKCYLHADFPRVECKDCGVKLADAPWARFGSGFTLLFEAFVMKMCQHMDVSSAARLVGEHDTRLWRIIIAYVDQARLDVDMSEVTQIGVDETSWKSRHHYITVFADLCKRRVLFVTEGKDSHTIGEFQEDLVDHLGDPAKITTVCMDLSPAFQAGVSDYLPNASQIFDRFHVVKLANDAVDQIRREDAKTNEVLKQTRYLWLSNPANLNEPKQQKLATIRAMNLPTAIAYQMKLNLLELWTLPTRDTAEMHLNAWCKWVASTRIGAPMKKLAKTIKAHAQGILNFFPDKLTSGLMEGINSVIQAAKAKARGYRNVGYFKTIIYLIAGKLKFKLPT
jgi:transposase